MRNGFNNRRNRTAPGNVSHQSSYVHWQSTIYHKGESGTTNSRHDPSSFDIKHTLHWYAWHRFLTALSILGHSLKGRQLVDWAQVSTWMPRDKSTEPSNPQPALRVELCSHFCCACSSCIELVFTGYTRLSSIYALPHKNTIKLRPNAKKMHPQAFHIYIIVRHLGVFPRQWKTLPRQSSICVVIGHLNTQAIFWPQTEAQLPPQPSGFRINSSTISGTQQQCWQSGWGVGGVEVILSWLTSLLTSGSSWDSPDGTGWSLERAWHNHPASLPSYCGSSSSLMITAQTLRHNHTTTTTTYKFKRVQWHCGGPSR